MNKDVEAYQSMKQCPRFDGCSAPICPLDPYQDERAYIADEPKCRLSRRVRLRLGRKLPRLGYTKMEWSKKCRSEAIKNQFDSDTE